jgi:ATP-dependent DNA helicase RecG
MDNQATQKKQLDFADLFLLWDIKKPSEKSIRKYTEEAKGLDHSVFRILEFCHQPKKRKEIMEDCLGISNQTKNFKTHLEPLIQKDLIQVTIKDKPNSQHQKYLIARKGKVIIYIHQHDEIY